MRTFRELLPPGGKAGDCAEGAAASDIRSAWRANTAEIGQLLSSYFSCHSIAREVIAAIALHESRRIITSRGQKIGEQLGVSLSSVPLISIVAASKNTAGTACHLARCSDVFSMD